MDKISVLIMAFCMIWTVVANIFYLLVRLVKLITCKGVENCRNRKCIINGICSKYDSRLTKEEADVLYKLVDEKLGKKNNEIF